MMTTLSARLLRDVPMIDPACLIGLVGRPMQELAAEHPVFKQLREKLRPSMELVNGVAIVPVEGVLARKPDVMELLLMGFEDTAHVQAMIQSAADNPDVSGILLKFDSPGGFVTGGPEVADLVRQTNKTKPVVAWTGDTMASLAYYIASQAGAIVATRSSQVGSIGVYTAHIDYSKVYEQAGVKIDVIKNAEADHKAAGVYGTSLTEDQRAHIQERIQSSFAEFARAVTTARPQVEKESMRGQVFTGAEAKRAGLVDRLGDMGFAMATLRQQMRARQ